MRRRRSPRSNAGIQKDLERAWCRRCKNTRHVPGEDVVMKGVTYSTVKGCPDCIIKDKPTGPAAENTPRYLRHIDGPSRAAGEKED